MQNLQAAPTPWRRALLWIRWPVRSRIEIPFLRLIVVLVAAAALLPPGYLVIRALGAGTAGLDFLLSERVLEVLLNSLKLMAGVTLASTAIGVGIAWFTTRTDLRFRRFWLILSLVPLAIPSFIGALAYIEVLGPNGTLQTLLVQTGLPALPSIYGFAGAWLTITISTYPYVILPVHAALQSMDPALEESARSLGHNHWSVFWRITLPQLRPAIATGMLLTALYTLSDFGAVALMRYNAFTRAIYLQYTSSFDRSRAAILALVLVALALVLVGLERRIASRQRNYRAGGASTARKHRPVTLGHWQIPAGLLLASIVGVGLVLPLAVLVDWLASGLRAGNIALASSLNGPATNTAAISLITALTAGIVALPVALHAVRRTARVDRWLINAAFLGNSLPGLVVALALVFFAATYTANLYQTFPLLVVGYLLRYLPLSIGATRSALTQVNPRYEEAGRSMGCPGWQVHLRITLPLIRTGVAGGMALVFLSVMKELPATLLLAPTGFKTLATQIWTAQNEAYMSQVALPAILLILTSLVSLGLIITDSKKGNH